MDSIQQAGGERVTSPSAFLWLMSAVGLAWRLWLAHAIFLNPDEALHYLLSVQPSLALTYQETLTTAHPPLYIVFLHYWGYLGHSELFLRLPSIVASFGFYWVIFLWLEKVASRKAALIALGLMLFSPALIYLSTEVRQYPFLLFFCAGALYFLECALEKHSIRLLMLSGFALWLALLTHYSSIFFALILGLYALLRIWSIPRGMAFTGIWAATQVVALAIIGILFKTHISKQISSGQAESIANSYLRSSIFHPAQDHVVSFIFKTTIRLFHYFFSQEIVGIAGLLLFVYGIVFLWRDRTQTGSRQLAFLLVFPLAVNCALAIKAIYPYGGTRHNSYLAIFVIPGIAIALARWNPPKKLLPVVLTIVLLACNLFSAPTGPYIAYRNQSRKAMENAVNSLREMPHGSIVFTDNQGGILLSYYFCNRKAVAFEAAYEDLFATSCGNAQVVSLGPRKWIFPPETFPEDLRRLQQAYNPALQRPVWIFQGGWQIDKQSDFRARLAQYGCRPSDNFGKNILICQIHLIEEMVH